MKRLVTSALADVLVTGLVDPLARTDEKPAFKVDGASGERSNASVQSAANTDQRFAEGKGEEEES